MRHGRCDCDCTSTQAFRALARKNQHRPILSAGTSPTRERRIKVLGCIPPKSRAASCTLNRGSKSAVGRVPDISYVSIIIMCPSKRTNPEAFGSAPRFYSELYRLGMSKAVPKHSEGPCVEIRAEKFMGDVSGRGVGPQEMDASIPMASTVAVRLSEQSHTSKSDGLTGAGFPRHTSREQT